MLQVFGQAGFELRFDHEGQTVDTRCTRSAESSLDSASSMQILGLLDGSLLPQAPLP
jgi:hypothetical protein